MSTNDAKERLEMKRQVKLLEASINAWDKKADIETGGGLAPVFERSSAEFSLADRSLGDLNSSHGDLNASHGDFNASQGEKSLGGTNGESEEFCRLRGQLQNRLTLSSSNFEN